MHLTIYEHDFYFIRNNCTIMLNKANDNWSFDAFFLSYPKNLEYNKVNVMNRRYSSSSGCSFLFQLLSSESFRIRSIHFVSIATTKHDCIQDCSFFTLNIFYGKLQQMQKRFMLLVLSIMR